MCADRDELASSVEALQDVDVVAEGTNGVEAAIADIKDDLDALRTSAGAELQPQVEAVQDAVDTLETAVDNLDSDGAEDTLTAVSNLAGAAGTLLASLDEGACG